MKKILTMILFSFVSATAMAHGPHGHWRSHGGGWNWVVPAVVGGVVVYEVTRPPVITQPQPVVIQQQTRVINDSNCSPWTQVQNPDGSVTITRTCNQ